VAVLLVPADVPVPVAAAAVVAAIDIFNKYFFVPEVDEPGFLTEVNVSVTIF